MKLLMDMIPSCTCGRTWVRANRPEKLMSDDYLLHMPCCPTLVSSYGSAPPMNSV